MPGEPVKIYGGETNGMVKGILRNAVYGEDGKLDVEKTLEKSAKRHRNTLYQKMSMTQRSRNLILQMTPSRICRKALREMRNCKERLRHIRQKFKTCRKRIRICRSYTGSRK